MWSDYSTQLKNSAKVITFHKTKEKIFSEIVNTLKWLLYQNQIFGLVSFNFTTREFQPSTLRIIWNIFFVLIWIPLAVGAVWFTTQDEATVIQKTTDIIHIVAFSVYVITVWIWSLINRDKYILVLKNLIEFDVKLMEKGSTIEYEKKKRDIMIRMAIRYAMLILSISVLIFLLINGMNQNQLLSEFLNYWTMIMNSAFCHQIIEITTMIKERFVILNKNLFKLVDQIKRLDVNVIENKFERDNNEKLATLCHICSLHHHLSKLIKLFNETFGICLLLMFGISFIVIVVALFYCTGGLQANQIDWINVLTPLFYSWTFAVDTIYVCDICYSTIEEVNKTGEIIHKIDTEDPDIRDEIEMFSLQIANEQVEFNAAGFFPINYALLFSIIGGVTTYIIILIQLSSTLNKK